MIEDPEPWRAATPQDHLGTEKTRRHKNGALLFLVACLLSWALVIASCVGVARHLLSP